MTGTKILMFKPHWKESISTLWNLIDSNWSVTSATYHYSKNRFTVNLSEKEWPEILLECCGCMAEFSPKDLLFRPSPSKLFYCITCDTIVRTAEGHTE